MKRLGPNQKVIIPFTLENRFIVIRTTMNNRFRLRFIVDTGAENTVLLDKDITDELQVNYRRKFTVTGSDLQRELVAYLATGIELQLDESLIAKHRSMLVLEENYANLDQVVGGEIHGILGADFLMRFAVEINYLKREMTLHDPSKYSKPKKFNEVPSVFHRHRAYLNLPVAFAEREPTVRKLLLDTGAGLTLLLHTYGDTLRTEDLPTPTLPSYIANGIGGQVNGNVGRARELYLADKVLEDVLTYFQPLDTVGKPFLNDREGLIGNSILSRYTVLIDYTREKVYLRPYKRAVRRKFKYDRSGLSIVAGGDRLRQFHVARIVPGSPADEAGLQTGDRIASVNRTSVTFLSLGGIIDRFRGRIGKRIKIKYVRDNRYYRTQFRLRELI